MRYRELANVEPQVGDVLAIEFGNTLVEATIQDLCEDGVMIELDQQALDFLAEAGFGTARYLAKNPEPLGSIERPDSPSKVVIKPDPSVWKKNKQEPELKTEPAKPTTRPAPMKPEATMEESQNAIDWGIKAISAMSNELKTKLRRSEKNTTLEYLLIVADRTNAFEKFKFTEQQLRDGQAYLGYVLGDPTIETWNDVVKNENNQGFNENAGGSMNYNDYIKQAEALHLQYINAIAAGDKQAMERIEKERDALDQAARQGLVAEAEYRGRKVPLGKPMKGDVKKSKVYVKGPKGNVVKVNFGDPNMRIKKSSPKHRKSFRARHNCDNPGPRWKARYWSCRAW